MSSIKSISPASIDSKILEELREIKKSLKESEHTLTLKRLTPTQTSNSPYFPDRNYANPLAVKGNPEETKWREVSSYEKNREILVNSGTDQDLLAIVNGKKLNII